MIRRRKEVVQLCVAATFLDILSKMMVAIVLIAPCQRLLHRLCKFSTELFGLKVKPLQKFI